MNPLVSVIIPTYNRAQSLGECLDAVVKQTYAPIEILVVDDGSTDGTERLVDRYGVRFLRLPHSGLPAVARNRGIDEAQGDYLAFCDSDDVWMPHKLETQVGHGRASGATFISSDALVTGGGGERYLGAYRFTYADLETELLWNNYVITSSVVVERNVLGQHRFDTRPSLRGYEDYALWLSLVGTASFGFLNEPLLSYRREGPGLSKELRSRDAGIQLHLMRVHPAYRRHPLLWARKFLRYAYHSLR